jgi:thioredoxin-related protein
MPPVSGSWSSWSRGAASIAPECTRRSSSSLDIAQLLDEEFFVVRLNMHGSLEAVDFDGEAMEERDLVRRWRNMFTPTMHFFRDEVPEA